MRSNSTESAKRAQKRARPYPSQIIKTRLCDQGKYDQALLNYKRSLQILQQSTPGGESQPIAAVYDRIASFYWRMDKPNEALTLYQKALQLELKYLPDNDRKISVSYFNLSTAYAKLNRLDDAIDCAENLFNNYSNLYHQIIQKSKKIRNN